MKSRIFSILAVLTLLLSALPAGLVSAEQGTIALDDTEYTNYTSGGSENIVVVTVTDEDLNTPTELTDDFAILGNAADANTTTYSTTNTNINSVTKVFDLYDGIAYFTAVSEDNSQVTLNTARDTVADANILTIALSSDVVVSASVGGVLTSTGDVAPLAAVPNGRITTFEMDLTDASADSAAATTGKITLFGTQINPDTLASSAAQTEIIDFSVANGGTATVYSTKYWLGDVRLGTTNRSEETVTAVVNQVRVIAIRYNYDEANTTNYLNDDAVSQTSVNVKSTTDPTGLDLSLTETGAATGIFTGEVALLSEATKEELDNQLAAGRTDAADAAFVNATHTLAELTNALGSGGTNSVASLAVEEIIDFIITDSDATNATTITAFLNMILVVTHDDVVTSTYADQGTGEDSASDTADIDTEAPVLSNIYPLDGDFTDDITPNFTVTMVDTDSGIDLVALDMHVYNNAGDNATPDVSDDVSVDPITDGYELTFIAGSTELGSDPGDGSGTEGLTHDWSFLIKDAVGNVATTDFGVVDAASDANDGAAGVSGKAMIQYTIDTNAPALSSAVTGISLVNDTGSNDEDEEVADAAWVKVIFTEDLDTSSLDVSDFEVDNDAPIALKFSAAIEDASDVDVANEAHIVYLQMASNLDPDSTPEVEVVDDIDDLSGNDVDEDELDAADKIAPTLVITVDMLIAEDDAEVTISMTSDEDLIQATIDVDVVNTQANFPVASTNVTMVKGAGNTWSGTFEIDDSSDYEIQADAQDEAQNAATQETENVQGDVSTTISGIANSGGVALNGTDTTEEGAVWIVSTFAEGDEYTGDTYDTITITEVSLVNDDADTIELAGAITDLMSDDDLVFTLAVELTPGDYTFTITGEDSVGNEDDATAAFEVIEKDPFSLSLNPGVNLVSIPSIAEGDASALSTLFVDTDVTSVITYDAAINANGGNPWLTSTVDGEGDWSGDITALEAGKSYFIETASSVTVDILLSAAGVEVPPSVAIYEGWNAIGFWSISGEPFADLDSYLISIDWSVAYSYDPTPGQGWKTLRADAVVATGVNDVAANNTTSPSADPGRGYLVYATADGTLTP